MKLFLAALTIWSLPLLGISCGSASVQEPQTARPAVKPEPTPTPSSETVTLTSQHPTGSFSIQPDLFKNPPQVLEVSVTKVVNPTAKPITIFVYLAPRTETDASQRVEIGNFSLYPADRPAKFLLDAAAAFRKASQTKDASAEWQLMFELDKTDQPESSPLEVTIAAPNWKSEKN